MVTLAGCVLLWGFATTASAQGEVVSPASDAVAIASTPTLPEAPVAARPNHLPADALPAAPDATIAQIRAGQARIAELNLELSELSGFDAWGVVMVLSGLLVGALALPVGAFYGSTEYEPGHVVALIGMSGIFVTALGFKLGRVGRRVRLARERDREVEALLRFEGVSLAVGSEGGMATLNWRL